MSLLLQTAKQAVKDAVRHPRSHKASTLHWVASLGGLGLFCVAVLDSSIIPLPLPGSTDVLLLLLTARRGTSAMMCVVLAICALAGSILGGYTCWSAGHKGGEVALENKVPARFLNKLKGWIERHGSLSVGVAALLPPPVPLMPFLLCAGALGIPRSRFLIAYTAGRIARYGLLAWLGATYGRQMLHFWQRTQSNITTPILWAYGGLLVLAAIYGLWKYLQSRRRSHIAPGAPSTAEDVA